MAFRAERRMGGIVDHWKAQDAGPTSGGRELLAAAQHQKAIGGQRQRDMVMETAPAAPLVVAQADLLLQLPVALLETHHRPLAAATTATRGVAAGRVTSQ